MNISLAIMAHPKRDEQIQQLLIQLVKMPFSDLHVALDTDNVEWHTGKRALQAGLTGLLRGLCNGPTQKRPYRALSCLNYTSHVVCRAAAGLSNGNL